MKERREEKEKRDVLNFRAKVAGLAAMALGRSWMSMVMVERALEGSAARKFRAVLPDLGLNGEKAVTTEVMYLVIMMAVGLWRERESGGRESAGGGCDEMGWDGMDWRRRRAEEPRQLQVRHLMRVHTSLNDCSLWTLSCYPSLH